MDLILFFSLKFLVAFFGFGVLMIGPIVFSLLLLTSWWCYDSTDVLQKVGRIVATVVFVPSIIAYCSMYSTTSGMPGAITQYVLLSYKDWKLDQKAVEPPIKTVVATEVRRYELVRFDPPKHVYVTLRDVKSNKVLVNQYVSKHCGQHPTVGLEYNVAVERYTLSNRPGEEFITLQNSYDAFCR